MGYYDVKKKKRQYEQRLREISHQGELRRWRKFPPPSNALVFK